MDAIEIIGEKIGFIDENVIQEAFLSTWCVQYKEEVQKILNEIREYLPTLYKR